MISTSIEINRVKQRLWISSIELVTRVRNEMKINDWWNRKENKKIQQFFFLHCLIKKKMNWNKTRNESYWSVKMIYKIEMK